MAFCLAASGIYFWNDALDVEADRLHPTKRFRPIAAGTVPVAHRQGRRHACSSSLASASPPLTGRWQTVAVVAVYVVLDDDLQRRGSSTSPCVDIVTVASGFVLRAAGGAVAVDVPMSQLVRARAPSFGSLFIVAGKRYAELREIGDDAPARAGDARRLQRSATCASCSPCRAARRS